MKRKNSKKKIVTALIVGVLAPILCFNLFEDDIKFSKSQRINQIAYADFNNVFEQREMQKSYNESLVENFGDNYKSVLSNNEKSALIAESIDKIINQNENYPDYFGGMYINDSGNLIFQRVNKNIPDLQNNEFKTYTEVLSKKVEIEEVEYSYNEISDINEKLIDYFAENKDNGIKLCGFYIDVFNNRLVVELEDISSGVIEKFKEEIIDSPIIVFKKGELDILTDAFNPGGYSEFSNAGPTMGYRAKRNGEEGYVTAGHSFYYQQKDDNINSGILRVKLVGENTPIDAAFIEIRKSASVSNTLAKKVNNISTLTTKTETGFFTAGQAIGKVGVTTGAVTGTIKSNSWSGYLTTKTSAGDVKYLFSGLVSLNAKNAVGDSGGPVFKIDSLSVNQTSANIIGIISGGVNGIVYVSRADKINSAFELTRY